MTLANMSDYPQQLQKMKAHLGFVAALDQSGGSAPKALRSYGIKEDAWSNEDDMFAIVHQMRTRIITSPSFTGERILGAILFEGTMDRDIEGQPSADYLWKVKRVVPFLKVAKGLVAEKDGVQLMKPMPELDALLAKAKAKRIFGTKMRSLINKANAAGIQEIVNQQFEAARQIIAAGLVPIVEPEVDIRCPEKAKAEAFLKAAILEKLNELPVGQLVMLKLTLPEQDDFYAELVSTAKRFGALNEAMAAMDDAMTGARMTGDPDHDFAAMMIPHHQGAVDMAKAELLYGRNPVLHRLAQEILVTQTSEITVMQQELGEQRTSGAMQH